MSVAIGVDVGTTAAQAVAVDEEGRAVATASSGYRCSRPDPIGPSRIPTETYDALHGVYRSVYASLREDMHRLAELAGA